jgi:pimeloyl-ACP methyl ester carboxylesterase
MQPCRVWPVVGKLKAALGAILASLFALAVAAPALAWEGATPPPGVEERATEPPPRAVVRVWRDLSYGSRASQKLDLYLPTGRHAPGGPGGRTAVVLVHGGAWSGFGKEADDLPPGGPVAPRIARRLAQRGLVVAAIDDTHGNIPAQVGDVRRALAWMRASPAQFGVAPSHTVAWGDSASGARRLRVPVLLVNSRQDPIVQLAESALPMRAANPAHVRLMVIPAIGHADMPEAFAPSLALVKRGRRPRSVMDGLPGGVT